MPRPRPSDQSVTAKSSVSTCSPSQLLQACDTEVDPPFYLTPRHFRSACRSIRDFQGQTHRPPFFRSPTCCLPVLSQKHKYPASPTSIQSNTIRIPSLKIIPKTFTQSNYLLFSHPSSQDQHHHVFPPSQQPKHIGRWHQVSSWSVRFRHEDRRQLCSRPGWQEICPRR